MFDPFRPAFGYAQAIGASSAVNARAVPTGVGILRLVSSVDCWVAIGGSPVASDTTGLFLPAHTPEYFRASVNDQVAVLGDSGATGVLNVVEMTR